MKPSESVADTLEGALGRISVSPPSADTVRGYHLALSCLKLELISAAPLHQTETETETAAAAHGRPSLTSPPLAWPRDEAEAAARWVHRRKALEYVSAVVAKLEQSEALALWPLYLPASPSSLFKNSFCDLLCSPHCQGEFESQLCTAVAAYLDKIGPLFGFVERKSANLGFTPLYQSLGESLLEAHRLLVRFIRASDRGRITAAVKALSSIVKNMPYKKLGLESLEGSLRLAHELNDDINPVARIAGLNLLSSVLAVGMSVQSSRFLDYNQHCTMLISAAFPKRVADNNVRYVALQCLAQLAAVNIDCLANNCELLSHTVDEAIPDKDDAIILHSLRFYKALAKLDPSRVSESAASPFFGLWNNLIKPRTFQSIAHRSDPLLMSALNDFIAEIGERTFAHFSVDQRALCISFLLSHCDEGFPVGIRSSAFRGLGMLLGFPFLQTDVAFLVDSAEKVIHTLSSPSAKGSIVVSAAWTLASLAQTLSEAAIDDDEQFPRHLILYMLDLVHSPKLCLTHTNVKVSLLRAAGCLMKCIDSSFMVNGSEEDLPQLLRKVLDFIVVNMDSKDKMMKVRWNASYAASKVLANPFFDAFSSWYSVILVSILNSMEGCVNFKVRINAAVALMSLRKRDHVGEHYQPLLAALLAAADDAENLDDCDGTESKHKMDLVDAAVLAAAHIVNLGSREDLAYLDQSLTRDQVDGLRFVLCQVQKRLAPEKLETLCKARENVTEFVALNMLFSDRTC